MKPINIDLGKSKLGFMYRYDAKRLWLISVSLFKVDVRLFRMPYMGVRFMIKENTWLNAKTYYCKDFKRNKRKYAKRNV